MARLRHQQLFSLHALNQAIAELLEDLNRRPFKRLDRPDLRPLQVPLRGRQLRALQGQHRLPRRTEWQLLQRALGPRPTERGHAANGAHLGRAAWQAAGAQPCAAGPPRGLANTCPPRTRRTRRWATAPGSRRRVGRPAARLHRAQRTQPALARPGSAAADQARGRDDFTRPLRKRPRCRLPPPPATGAIR